MCLPEDAVTNQWRVGIGDELWIWILGLASVKLEMVIRPCRRSRFLGVQEPQLQGGTTEWTRWISVWTVSRLKGSRLKGRNTGLATWGRIEQRALYSGSASTGYSYGGKSATEILEVSWILLVSRVSLGVWSSCECGGTSCFFYYDGITDIILINML
jgi:hypothetical protein